jgi:transcriptional regulator with XRE-family HTH domain
MNTSGDLQHAFGVILREKRKACGLSQERLALEAGVDRTFVSLLEREQRQPTLSTLFALCGPLGIKPSELLREIELVMGK